jgi:hypothetical protein
MTRKSKGLRAYEHGDLKLVCEVLLPVCNARRVPQNLPTKSQRRSSSTWSSEHVGVLEYGMEKHIPRSQELLYHDEHNQHSAA